MGAIIGKFRKKQSTLEKLEELDKDIKCIEKYKYHTQQTEKRIIGQFIVVSACIYILSVIVYYYMFVPSSLNEQVLYVTPLLLIPVILWFVKKLLKWYYRRKLTKNETKLTQLMKEKKKLLDQVMDTETYKVAKTILEKFAPDNLRKSPTLDIGATKSPLPSTLVPQTPANTVRNRNLLAKTPVPPKPFPTAGSSHMPLSATPGPLTNGQRSLVSLSNVASSGLTQNLPMPRSILPRERSMLDKMVEYLVGDGPNNRYALICKHCNSHNGMALREEFDYIAFRCCYCFTFNPSRKLRPSAPKLEEELTPMRRRLSSATDKSSSESEKISESDTESDKDHHCASKSSSKQVSDAESSPVEADTIDPTILKKEN